MKLWDFSGYSEKSNIQEAYLPKTSISGQIVSEILAQLWSDGSKRLDLSKIWGYWRWITSVTKQTVKKEFYIFLSHIRLQKQHSSLMYRLKICKTWVRSQLHVRWAWNWLKLNVTSSNVWRIIIHWLSARRDVGLTQRSLIPKEHRLYRALKHSILQHKLDLDLSKTKQPLPIITNSHLNFRYLTASANL